MVNLLMPKATAVWLVENTGLTFKQIAELCNLHELEVQGIADDEIAKGITPSDPIASGQLTRAEIDACEKDPNRSVQLANEIRVYLQQENKKTKSASYIPVARRQDKPNAIAWLLRNCPEMTHTNIAKLIGTTKKTIESISGKTHWNIQNIKAQDPVLLGLCLQSTLDAMYEIAKQKYERANPGASATKGQETDSRTPGDDMKILEGFSNLSSISKDNLGIISDEATEENEDLKEQQPLEEEEEK